MQQDDTTTDLIPQQTAMQQEDTTTDLSPQQTVMQQDDTTTDLIPQQTVMQQHYTTDVPHDDFFTKDDYLQIRKFISEVAEKISGNLLLEYVVGFLSYVGINDKVFSTEAISNFLEIDIENVNEFKRSFLLKHREYLLNSVNEDKNPNALKLKIKADSLPKRDENN